MIVKKIHYEVVLFILIWAVLTAVNGWIRPMVPSNELHYVSVAWEMWQHHHFLVPIQTGIPYHEKPPLLFWLIHFGWFLFGVSSWWPRLMPQLFNLATLWLTYRFAQALWPERKEVARIAPLILLAVLIIPLQLPITWFDNLISFFCLLSLWFIYLAVERKPYYWMGFALSICLGILAKGPVIFVFVLPAALFMPWWASPRKKWGQTYAFFILAILAAIVLVLCWVIPAVVQGGPSYTHNILWTQSFGRVSGQRGFQAWYYYLIYFPILLLPWTIWPRTWIALTDWSRSPGDKKDRSSLRFLGLCIIPGLVLLSCFASKSSRYLYSLLPMTSLFLAYLFFWRTQESKYWDRLILVLLYISAGIIYLSLKFILSPATQHRYFWLSEISPVWGWATIFLGFCWLYYSQRNMNRVIIDMVISTALLTLIMQFGINKVIASHNDLRPLALKVKLLQDRGITVGFPKGDLMPEELIEFFGRLSQPIVIRYPQVTSWKKSHPQAWMIVQDISHSPSQFQLKPVAKLKPFEPSFLRKYSH